jgi:two-component system OmpR family sensor kinase
VIESLRMRLTLWYSGALALVLLCFSAAIYLMVSHKLYNRFDAQMGQTLEEVANFLGHEKTEGEDAAEAIRSLIADFSFPKQTIALYDQAGRRLARKPESPHLDAPLDFKNAALGQVHLRTLSEQETGVEDGVRIASRSYDWEEGCPIVIVLAQPLTSISDELELLGGVLSIAIPLTLLLAGWGGWGLARKSLSPIKRMSEAARSISANNLNERLPISNPHDELGRLAESFNDLLVRLNASFDQQRQFMADASHELRTPLSVLRTTTEVTLEKPRREEREYRESLSLIDAQTKRLARIVEDMFTIARADAGHRPLQPTNFYLDELIAETVRVAQVLAERKGITVDQNAGFEAPYRGDEGLLRQMLLNLLDNAIKHTPAGGKIKVDLARRDSMFEIKVSDTGVGVPAELQSRIFERFFRVDKSRSRTGELNGGGAGLGLSIARWIAESHHGKLELIHSAHTGSVFVAALPMGNSS